jgi:hypothetical protein
MLVLLLFKTKSDWINAMRKINMEKEELLALYDGEMRIAIEIPGTTKQNFPDLVRFLRPAPGMNFILYSRIHESELPSVISSQINDLKSFLQPFSWQVFEHDQPDSLSDHLVAHGFIPSDDPDNVLVLEVDRIDYDLGELKPVYVRKLDSIEQLEDVASIERQVLGGDFSWLVKRLGDHMKVPDYLSVYVAYQNDEPASTGWIYFNRNSQFASLYGGATVSEKQGQDLYRSVVEARIREALQRGYRFITTGASAMSLPILLRMGFEQLTVSNDFQWKGEG